MTRVKIMGCPVDCMDMQETIEKVEGYIRNKEMCQHVVVNVSKFVEMRNNPEYKRIISQCDIINADGMPLVWASKLLGKSLPSRVAGVDLFQELVRVCSVKGYKPFFFGAKELIVKDVVKRFTQKYPDLNVAGYRNGYFDEDEAPQIVESIKKSGADMLFVGFSSPMKENFLNKWMPIMQVPFCMGVGGGFDIVAGKTKRAPLWMQNVGLEWLYRIYQEPRRMWKRYAKTNPVFCWLLAKEILKNRIINKQL